jgi:serine/threonine protein phosphatase PrpC
MYVDGIASRLDAAMVTDAGPGRVRNGDMAHVDDEGLFFIVADGMGVASRMAVDVVRRALDRERGRIAAFARSHDHAARRLITGRIDAAVRAAHEAIVDCGPRESGPLNMGAMLDVVVVAGDEAFVAHVGDTRTYLIRGGDAAQITTDHTLAELMVLEGSLPSSEAKASPLRAVVINAVGACRGDLVVEIAHVGLERGDRLLVCTDGLHGGFDDEHEVAAELAAGTPGQRLARAVELARERGGHDDITGVLVDILDVEPIDDEVTAVRSPRASTAPLFDDEETRPIGAWDAFVVELREHAD